jgi:hypothetical protein
VEEAVFDFHKDFQFKHWWFTGRNRIIQSFLSAEIKKKNNSIIDIGAGYGACIPVLKNFGEVDVLEPYMKAHPYLKEMGVNKIYEITEFPSTYPDKKYDIVTYFDVIEHIEDDLGTLTITRQKLLNPNGKCIITVPAYQWLWTNHDKVNMHFRRYSRKTLKKVLQEAGFKNIRISYFMNFLFPIALMDRLIFKFKKHEQEQSSPTLGIMNKVFGFIFNLEAPLISKVNFPFGLSLIAKAEV